MTRAILAAALAGLSLAAVAAGGGPTYDLRGPAPRKGQKVTRKGALALTGGKLTADDGAGSSTYDVALSGAAEEELEVLAVEGRQVTRARLKFGKAASEVAVTLGGKERKARETKALSGETVLLERVKGKWKKELAGGKPTAKQAGELEGLDAPADEGLSYPETKAARGHRWDVKPAQVARLLGGGLTGLTGKASAHFRAVEKLGGEECAVIDFELDVRGTSAGGDKAALSFKGTSTVHRSLKSGVDLKIETAGSMRLSSKATEGGKAVESDLRGKLRWVGTAGVK